MGEIITLKNPVCAPDGYSYSHFYSQNFEYINDEMEISYVGVKDKNNNIVVKIVIQFVIGYTETKLDVFDLHVFNLDKYIQEKDNA